MVVAGLLYDTLYDRPGVTGPRWHREMIPSKGFVARHPGGLLAHSNLRVGVSPRRDRRRIGQHLRPHHEVVGASAI